MNIHINASHVSAIYNFLILLLQKMYDTRTSPSLNYNLWRNKIVIVIEVRWGTRVVPPLMPDSMRRGGVARLSRVGNWLPGDDIAVKTLIHWLEPPSYFRDIPNCSMHFHNPSSSSFRKYSTVVMCYISLAALFPVTLPAAYMLVLHMQLQTFTL